MARKSGVNNNPERAEPRAASLHELREEQPSPRDDGDDDPRVSLQSNDERVAPAARAHRRLVDRDHVRTAGALAQTHVAPLRLRWISLVGVRTVVKGTGRMTPA